MWKNRLVSLATRKPLWGIAYVVMVIAIVSALFHLRDWSIATFGNPQAMEEWQTWRADVDKMPKNAPVARRVPKSPDPPALVLLTEHFTVCLVISVTLSSALFLTIMIMVRGALLSPGTD